jgi:UDP-glucuronate 4-epimerase
MLGFLNILEGSRHNGVKHLIYASTSSVYGAHTNQPFSIHDGADHPVSLYAATKKANELMAHSYSSMYGLPTTGLRFFTVYGPWGRPDMALFLFTKKILNGEPIDVFNFGKCRRDFTYIADIVEGLMRVVQGAPTNPNPAWLSSAPDPATSSAPYAIYNIGNNQSVELMRYIEVIEDCLGKKAKKNFLPPQVGDVESTDADVSDLIRDFHYQPETAIEKGIKNFVLWYREYYGV